MTLTGTPHATCLSQVVTSIQVFQQKFSLHFLSHTRIPHAPPVFHSLIWLENITALHTSKRKFLEWYLKSKIVIWMLCPAPPQKTFSVYYIFWVWICSLGYPSCKVRAPYYIAICGLSGCTVIFSTLSHKRLSENLLNTKCVFWFSVQHLSDAFLLLKRIHRDVRSVERKSIGLKFSKSQTGSDVLCSCHHNSSRCAFVPFLCHPFITINHTAYILTEDDNTFA